MPRPNTRNEPADVRSMPGLRHQFCFSSPSPLVFLPSDLNLCVDAPALAQATVGVAMGSGTDVARESSDIVLIGSDLTKFVETVRIARRCHHTIMQNFVGTLVVDAIGVGMAAFGFLNPLLAAFIHVSSEMTFILNSARLLPPVSLGNRFVRRVFASHGVPKGI